MSFLLSSEAQNLERRLLFVNDSKATNAEASEQALKSFNEIYWIAGGVAEEGGINRLASHMQGVRHAFLIGEAAQEFSKTLDEVGVSYDVCVDLERAVKKAVEVALGNGTSGTDTTGTGTGSEAAILLSPAAASFDQYPNFEIRGDAFKDIVRSIDGVSMSETLV